MLETLGAYKPDGRYEWIEFLFTEFGEKIIATMYRCHLSHPNVRGIIGLVVEHWEVRLSIGWMTYYIHPDSDLYKKSRETVALYQREILLSQR